jgi:hypothetical protein
MMTRFPNQCLENNLQNMGMKARIVLGADLVARYDCCLGMAVETCIVADVALSIIVLLVIRSILMSLEPSCCP